MSASDLSYTEALRTALHDELASDPSVFLLGEDIARYGGAFGVTRGLVNEFGEKRVCNTPISEGGIVGVAIGAALGGLRPVVEIMFMDFITLAVDQLVNQAAKLRYVFGKQASCPLVVRTPGGAGRGYGPTHSQTLSAWFAHIPGLKVIAPSSPSDAYAQLRAAIRDPNPVIFVEHKLLYNERESFAPDQQAISCLGGPRIIREGEDATVVAWSGSIRAVRQAATALAAMDIDIEIIDVRTLAPILMDEILESARKTGRVLIVEEAPLCCAISAELGFRIFEGAFEYLESPVRRLTAPHMPVPASPALEPAFIPDAKSIVDAVASMVRDD